MKQHWKDKLRLWQKGVIEPLNLGPALSTLLQDVHQSTQYRWVNDIYLDVNWIRRELIRCAEHVQGLERKPPHMEQFIETWLNRAWAHRSPIPRLNKPEEYKGE